MPPSPRIDGRVIDCFGAKTNRDRNEITCTIVRVLGGVSLHPCNLFHRLITARTHPRVKVGHCWSNGERPLTVSPTRYSLILRCSHPKGMTTCRQDKIPNRKKRILVEAGYKEEVASRLVTERRQSYSRKSWWTCVNVPRPHDERVSLVLSHRLITYDLFLSCDCQIYSELGEPVFLGHLQL